MSEAQIAEFGRYSVGSLDWVHVIPPYNDKYQPLRLALLRCVCAQREDFMAEMDHILLVLRGTTIFPGRRRRANVDGMFFC